LRLWSVFAGLLLVCPIAGAASQNRMAQGAEVFDSTGCRHCHTIGNSGGHVGPNLSGIGLTKTAPEIRRQIVKGGKGMPPFGGILQRGQINDLVAYLRSCREKVNEQGR
jgi:mono/diheme cytochrome c family protein